MPAAPNLAATPISAVGAARRAPAALNEVKADLRTAGRQLDALIGEVRRLQRIVHELEAQAAF